MEKKKKLLREVIMKIELKQKDNKKGIVVEALLNNSATRLVMSSEFVKKNRFKKKLDRPIYMRNVDGTFNYKELIKHIVEMELFYRGHREKTVIDMIDRQK